MQLETWYLYLLTLLVFMAAPGPSHLLMLSTSLTHGFKPSLATAAGDLSANLLQITLAGMGLAAVVVSSASVFLWVKWGGVAYLAWLGLRQILRSFSAAGNAPVIEKQSARSLWLRGFVSSAANPKAVIFFAALFPQFINPAGDALVQVVLLGATYLVVDGLFLAAYGVAAERIGIHVKQYRHWLDRIAGGLLIAVAIALGLRSVERVA